MRQATNIGHVMNFNHIEILNKKIKWMMFVSAPILWIALFIMIVKGRDQYHGQITGGNLSYIKYHHHSLELVGDACHVVIM